MNIAIYGKVFNSDMKTAVQELFAQLEKHGATLFIEEDFTAFLAGKITFQNSFSSFVAEEIHQLNIDLLFSVGGDGTILEAVSIIKDSGIPILGINTGRLGFLSSIQCVDASEAITAVFANEYTLEPRSLLTVTTTNGYFSERNFALNELTVSKKDTSSMITINTYINDEYLNAYWADGLIVSTPTGSTAYSLSCGGPILTPDSKNFVITPISPHNLNARPIIVPDDAVLKLKVEGRSKQYLTSLDSFSIAVDNDTELTIQKADFQINLVKLSYQKFYNTLRNKLMWGIDKRN